MRACVVIGLLLAVFASPLLTQTPSLDSVNDDVMHSSPMQASISPTTGWTTGGEEITITGSGFSNLAFSNTTDDGINHQWAKTTMDYSVQAGTWNAVDVDSNGHIHVVQIKDGNYEIRHSVNDGTGWNSGKIKDCGNTYCWDIHMVIDDNDHIHLAYTTYTQWAETLVYMNYDGTTWTDTSVSSSAHFGPIGIAVDSSNHPHISYAANGADQCGNGLRIASYTGTAWSHNTVVAGNNRGCDSAIVIDESDNIYIAYQNRDSSKLMIATDKSGSWDSYLVDTGTSPSNLYPGYMTSMAMDGQGQFHIAHQDSKEDDLRYSTGAPNSGWTTTVVESTGSTGRDPSIAVDAADQPHIVYHTWSGQNLKYATIDPVTTNWAVTTMASGADVGEGNSIVIDESGVMHVPFSDGTSEVLKYATKSTGLVQTKEITVQFGQYGSMTGAVVNDTTIRVSTPATSAAATVSLSLWDKDGNEHPLSPTFQSIDQNDLDGDGVLNANDDCPNVAGTSDLDVNGCPDDDGDGYSNAGDAFPNNVLEWMDADGDGVGDNADAFPNDANETLDSDGDGAGDNSDAFPLNSLERFDSDGDGVGDNADVFPNNPNETTDSDGDGLGDNGDAFPNNAYEQYDSDGDGVGDNSDAFPNDSSESLDHDADGVGDLNDLCSNTAQNAQVDATGCSQAQLDSDGDGIVNTLDAFPILSTQWADTDGDGYGDNWGDSEWNESRMPEWPGVFVIGAVQSDYCPDVSGNSTADGFYGCIDEDGNGIPDQLQQEETNQTGEGNETQTPLDSDNDGVSDAEDNCPDSPPEDVVDSYGCAINETQGDGESSSPLESFFAGDAGAVTTTVGIGAILLALFTVLQTNAVAAILPDTFRWVQVLRTNSKLSKEEENELTYLQSLVQAYYDNPQELVDELNLLRGDLTGRYTNNEIKKDTREKLFTLIDDLLIAPPQELYRIAHNDAYFGLAGTLDSEDRSKLLEEKIAMSEFSEPAAADSTDHYAPQGTDDSEPPVNASGLVRDDGFEWLESPQASGVWWYRVAHSNQSWQKWQS